MVRNTRIRFWIEVALAVLAAALAMVTLITREWIELLFGIDPDRGSGALEWAVVVALFVASVALAVIATWDRKRHIVTAGR
jgi:ABC-type amino acid transport system permease subunit